MKKSMKKHVSLDKQSKKAQRKYYAARRRTWGELNPVTRSVPSGKVYNRKKARQALQRIGREFRDGLDAGSFFIGMKRNVIVRPCDNDEDEVSLVRRVE